MRNSLMIAGLFMAGSAFAAETDTINLSGEVASTLSIECTDTADAADIDLDAAGPAELVVKVADCTGTTNDDAGLTFTFNPDANFSSAGTDVFTYAVLALADGDPAPAAATFGADDTNVEFTSSASGPADTDVYIHTDSDPNADPGTYTSTIAVTSANNS